MEPLIVEILERNGRVATRLRLDGKRLHIGRAYDNDVILDDPYVSPEHAELFRDDEGIWHVHDCATTNGTRHSRHGRLNDARSLVSGDEIELGRSRLRVIFPGHVVPPAMTEPLPPRWVSMLDRPVMALTALLALAAMMAYARLIDSREVMTWADLAAPAARVIAFVLAWGAGWALLGWLLQHRHSFAGHCSALALALVALFGLEHLTGYVQFWTNGERLAGMLPYAGTLLLGLGLLYASLLLATQLRRRTVLLLTHSVCWGLLGVVVLGQLATQPDFLSRPDYATDLKPPVLSWQPAQPPEAFSEAVAATFEELERKSLVEEQPEENEDDAAGEAWRLLGR